ncbi:MAG TPA: FdhF/YdeP family oxidoreductase [Verrucomicrobiota bacterium]|nr:formate dehydrogenase [Verrucomicrobiales bacterium]HRI12214.1 FdhF/YdeP family oxidoreductase [Verrucomicrobiota bacterium]
MSQRVEQTASQRLASWVPFGLGQTKPQHFRDMLGIAWKNRDNLGYAWKVLSRGVCDGCALGVAGFHDWTIPGVHLCMTRLNLLRLNTMPEFAPELLADVAPLRSRSNAELREMGRLAYPMIRKSGERGFTRISWADVHERLGSRLRRTDPRRLAFFVTSRGVTNEVYYVAQKVARFLGTNHVDNAARLCHAPSTGAMKHALGYAASTCSYCDWYGTDLIVFFGANPANDQPVTTKYLHEAKALGTRVALVNPYFEPGMRRYWVPSSAKSAIFGTDIADWWFPVSQGGDIAFLYAVLKVLIDRGGVNKEFIAAHSGDWDQLRARCAELSFDELASAAGLPRAAIEEFATILQSAKNAVFVWSMGITQHVFGGDAVSMVLNVGLARGYVGRPKNGLMPIRGHSSVQGGAEMGCYSTALPGGKPITAGNVADLSAQYGFPVPDWPGLNSVEMVDAAGAGDLDVLYCLGGNFLRTLPEPAAVATALSRVPVRVHQDIILTDQMFVEPDEEVILLPAKTRYEQDGGGIETTTERRVAFSPEIPRQVGEAKAEWRILRDLAAAAWPERASLLGCESGPAICQEIARVVSFYAGCEKLHKTGDAIQWGGERLCDGGSFATPDGKAHFKVVSIPGMAGTPVIRSPMDSVTDSARESERSFVVSTRRGKQFNTLIYAEVDPLTGAPREAVFMNPSDAQECGFTAGERVALVNATGRYEGIVFPAPIAQGNLQIHWPEGNVIIPKDIVDPVGGVPDYNASVRVERLSRR